ncbi:MAG TPA: hypothetical protein VGE74_23185 [Gemmata sp.]
MRRFLILLVLLAVVGCGKSSPSTVAEKAKEQKKKLDLPMSEDTANEQLVGLTGAQAKKLCGQPDAVTADPAQPADELWHYNSKIWLKPRSGNTRTVPFGMTLTLREGKVIQVAPRS